MFFCFSLNITNLAHSILRCYGSTYPLLSLGHEQLILNEQNSFRLFSEISSISKTMPTFATLTATHTWEHQLVADLLVNKFNSISMQNQAMYLSSHHS